MCNDCNTPGVYNLHCIHCAARFLLSWHGDRKATADVLVNKYGHDRDKLREVFKAMEKAR